MSQNAALIVPAGIAALQFIAVELLHDGWIGLEEFIEELDLVKGV